MHLDSGHSQLGIWVRVRLCVCSWVRSANSCCGVLGSSAMTSPSAMTSLSECGTASTAATWVRSTASPLASRNSRRSKPR